MSTTVLVSSLAGIHQNSNVTSGGGTDDTATIQAALNAGPFPLILVQDGASLITGLNVNSNTTIQCSNSSCGFYAANSANQSMFRNANRSGSVISDHDITFDNGTYNGNTANQSGKYDANGAPRCCMSLFGVKNIEVKNLTTLKAPYAGVEFGNYQNVNVHDCTFTSADNTTLETSGVDVRGPGTNATLKNLTILCGDDAIGVNARDYTGIVNVGPYILGGTITNLTIDTINFQNTWSGIDLIPDAGHGYTVNDVYIQNLSGSVQNYALYLNRDLYNTPPASGVCTNVYVAGANSVSLSGSPAPYGGLIPSGLWLVDTSINSLQMSGFTPSTQTIKLPTSAGVATSLVLSGNERGPLTGPVSVGQNPVVITQSGANKAQLTPIGSGTTAVKAFPQNTFATTTLVVFVLGYYGSGACTISSISDTIGNTYTEQASFSDGATGHIAKVYTCRNAGSGANTVTVTFGQSTAACGLEVAEYTFSSVDQVSSLFLDGAETTVTCPTVTTTKTNEVVLGIGSTATTGATAAGGFTMQLSGASSALGVLEDKQVMAIGAVTPSWTQTSNAGYKATMSLAGLASQGSWVISGNAGVAGATVSYSGTASGSVVADSTGNYAISALASGSYTITPSLSGYTFSAPSSQTISSADITAVNFTASIAGGSGGWFIGDQSSLLDVVNRRRRI
jgi:hypothetical protein